MACISLRAVAPTGESAEQAPPLDMAPLSWAFSYDQHSEPCAQRRRNARHTLTWSRNDHLTFEHHNDSRAEHIGPNGLQRNGGWQLRAIRDQPSCIREAFQGSESVPLERHRQGVPVDATCKSLQLGRCFQRSSSAKSLCAHIFGRLYA